MTTTPNEEYEFDVALSFAGSDREIARIVARVASANGLRVFIDESHEADMWGKNLVERLGVIYDGRAKYCVILISEEYVRRPFTRLERRYALDRAIELRREYILPVRLDDAWLEGLPRSTAYMDCREGRMTPLEVANTLVKKLRGIDAVIPEGVTTAKVSRTDYAEPATPTRATHADTRALAFVHVQPLADNFYGAESVKSNWKESSEGAYSGSSDPAFDITVLNRAGRAVVLTAVGVEFVRLGFVVRPIFGGGGAEEIDLHRTYQLDLPDLWVRLADIQRAAGVSFEEPPYVVDPTPARELVTCKVPDPVLLHDGAAYRFGLQLFDYQLLCPNRVVLRFWVRTDVGEDRSDPVTLSYFIGMDVVGHSRYKHALGVELFDVIQWQAYNLWEEAGRPDGRDVEFWQAAKGKLSQSRENRIREVRGRRRFVLPPDYAKLYASRSRP